MTSSRKLLYPQKSHPDRAGRKPALFPIHTKKFRATKQEWDEFLRLLNAANGSPNLVDGDARVHFLIIFNALKQYFSDVSNDR